MSYPAVRLLLSLASAMCLGSAFAISGHCSPSTSTSASMFSPSRNRLQNKNLYLSKHYQRFQLHKYSGHLYGPEPSNSIFGALRRFESTFFSFGACINLTIWMYRSG